MPFRHAAGIFIFAIAVSICDVASACMNVTHAAFAEALAAAHEHNALASLDQKYPLHEPFEVYIEHSIHDPSSGEPPIVVKSMQSFQELAQFLAARQNGAFPKPKSRPLRQCANGVCSYESSGTMHNTLYLKELRYNDYVDCLRVQVIWFLDGD
jgi:hypothetical protein